MDIQNIIDSIIDGFLDSIEEFADAVKFPTASYTKQAFFVSLIFTAVSMVLDAFGISTIIQWQEGLVCNIFLLIVSMVDASTRSEAKKLSKQFGYNIQEKVNQVKGKIVNVSNNNGEEVQQGYFQDDGSDVEDTEGYWGDDGSYHFYDEDISYSNEGGNDNYEE